MFLYYFNCVICYFNILQLSNMIVEEIDTLGPTQVQQIEQEMDRTKGFLLISKEKRRN